VLRAKMHSVLIVEDERIVAKDLQQTLAGMGYDAFAIASSADEALARASARCPDVVLMDIRIKGQRDGVEAAEILRAQFDVPVVYLTAHADDATIERAMLTGPYGYLLKPVKAAELKSAIEVSVYRHAMEKRLREREKWFSTTLRSLSDAVMTVDLGGNVSFMNPIAEQLTGVQAASAIGRPAREIMQLVHAEHTFSPLDQALAQGRTVHIPEAALAGPGASTPTVVSDSAAPVIDDGQLLGAVMVFRDITEQKRLQTQLELSDRLASLGTMAAGVAHEVNNPLSVVVANASFVQDELKALLFELEQGKGAGEASVPRLREAVAAQAQIQAAASRIARIAADLKAFAEPTTVTATGADVARALDWALRTTAHEFRHRARVITHLARVPAVALDETRLGQVLVNLLINAAHAIEPGDAERNEVNVSVRTAGERVGFEVSDTGSGMAPEVLKRVFEPFFTTKPVGVGTGLGLSICHGIVASAGGSLRAESRIGRGSSFHFELPLAKPTNIEPVAPLTEPALQRRGRVLVVDDEAMVLSTIGRILREHDPVCVDSPKKALELMDQAPFDVIFTDLMMPDMTGMDFYEELLRTRPEAARRVIFLSGGVVNPRVKDFLATVPNRRLEKPFRTETLKSLVQQALASPR